MEAAELSTLEEPISAAQRTPPLRGRLLSVMFLVGGLTGLANLVLAAKELAVARQFGVGDAVDAFVFASMLPMFASSVIGHSFSAALIPTYIKVRETEGQDRANRLVSTTMVWAIGLMLAVSIVLGVAFPLILPLFKMTFTPEKLALTRWLFLVMLPVITLRSVVSIYGAVLNSGGKYGLAATTPAITPFCMMASMLLFGGSIGVYSLGAGMVAGMAVEMVILGRGLRRTRMPLRPRWYGMDEHAKQVVRQYLPMIAGSCLGSSTIVVDQSFASTLAPGSLSTLSYASKMVGFSLGICATAVSTAVLPHFSSLVARGQWQETKRALHTNLSIVIACTALLAAGLYIWSEPIVRLVFQHGAFNAADTAVVAEVQRMYAMQIPFYVAGVFVVRLISSLQANSILMWGAGLNVIVNVVLDYVLMKKMGVSGIALSTTGVYIISFIYCWIALNRRMAALSAK